MDSVKQSPMTSQQLEQAIRGGRYRSYVAACSAIARSKYVPEPRKHELKNLAADLIRIRTHTRPLAAPIEPPLPAPSSSSPASAASTSPAAAPERRRSERESLLRERESLLRLRDSVTSSLAQIDAHIAMLGEAGAAG